MLKIPIIENSGDIYTRVFVCCSDANVVELHDIRKRELREKRDMSQEKSGCAHEQ